MKCSGNFESVEYYLLRIFASLTILGCFSISIVCLKYKLIRVLSFRIVFLMSLNDIILAFVAFIPKTHQSCKWVSYIFNTVYMSNLCLAGFLTNTIYRIIVLEDYNFQRYFKPWFYFSYFVIPLTQAIPFFTNDFEEVEGFCQISFSISGTVLRFSLLYVPGLAFLGYLLWIYFKIKIKARIIGEELVGNLVLDKGFIYPLIIAGFFLPLAVATTVQSFTDNCEGEMSSILLNDVGMAHGFMNAIVFFMNKFVRNTIKESQMNEDTDFITGSTLKFSFTSNTLESN